MIHTLKNKTPFNRLNPSKPGRILRRCGLLLACWVVVLIIGCTSTGVISNTPRSATPQAANYSILAAGQGPTSAEVALILAFSGGGTRAAALAYGVLEELRDTAVTIAGHQKRLLDEVDMISSVSGGSFTSAYYGLYGDRIFQDFETVFLRQDFQGQLIRGLLSPRQWFSSTGRTDMAVKFYEESVFHGATFADMNLNKGPLVLINATDLSHGVRFSFVQEYFNLLCSDITTFPVARAVTASSAVPLLFNPVAVQNFPNCNLEKPKWLQTTETHAISDQELAFTLDGLESYLEKDQRQYIHFVDGGISDNLGLRAIYDIIEIAGGAKAYSARFHRTPPKYLVVISVNASTHQDAEMDKHPDPPGLDETVNAVTNAQIRRYNATTLALIDTVLERWAQEISTSDHTVTPYFIQLSIDDTADPATLKFLNGIPTSFVLSDEQVDQLITSGHELLRANPVYREFLSELRQP